MRGILIQLSFQLKKEKTQKMQDFLKKIKTLETTQRTSPSPSSHKDLFEARLQIRRLMISNYGYQLGLHITTEWISQVN